MRVGEAIIDLLVREYDLDTVFGIPGVHNIELFRGLHRSGARRFAPPAEFRGPAAPACAARRFGPGARP